MYRILCLGSRDYSEAGHILMCGMGLRQATLHSCCKIAITPTTGVLSVIACSIRGDVKNIFFPPPEARIWFATSSPC